METRKKLLKQLGLDSLRKIASKSLNKTKQSLNKTFRDLKKKRDEKIANKIQKDKIEKKKQLLRDKKQQQKIEQQKGGQNYSPLENVVVSKVKDSSPIIKTAPFHPSP